MALLMPTEDGALMGLMGPPAHAVDRACARAGLLALTRLMSIKSTTRNFLLFLPGSDGSEWHWEILKSPALLLLVLGHIKEKEAKRRTAKLMEEVITTATTDNGDTRNGMQQHAIQPNVNLILSFLLPTNRTHRSR